MSDNKIIRSQPLLFDPIQFAEFGLSFHESEKFSIRFQQNNRLLFKNIYVPYGPICEDEEGLDNALDYLKRFKFSKIKVDLPLILDESISKKVKNCFQKNSFRSSQYIQDEETILLTKSNINLEQKDLRYYNRKVSQKYKVVVKKDVSSVELGKIYALYIDSAARIGYSPKPISVFKKLSENCIISLGHNLESDEIESFVFGHVSTIDASSYLSEKNSNILRIMFIGSNEEARKSYTGYLLHTELIKACFEQYEIDIIDLYGASRSKGRGYTKFKESFGGEFIKLPGSFEILNII